jgi:hypothetical protein
MTFKEIYGSPAMTIPSLFIRCRIGRVLEVVSGNVGSGNSSGRSVAVVVVVVAIVVVVVVVVVDMCEEKVLSLFRPRRRFVVVVIAG